MQLTRFTDYSLRVLVYLAATPGRLCTIAEIAACYEISESHLTKVVSHLAAAGYIDTVRGKGGGMALARSPDLINVGEVVRDCEDNMDIVECFNLETRSCPLLPGCTLKSVLIEARRNFLSTLDAYNLQQMLGGRAQARLDADRTIRIRDPRPRARSSR